MFHVSKQKSTTIKITCDLKNEIIFPQKKMLLKLCFLEMLDIAVEDGHFSFVFLSTQIPVWCLHNAKMPAQFETLHNAKQNNNSNLAGTTVVVTH